MILDALDKKILSFLQEDGRISFVTLAEKLEVSEGTIRKRIRKLEEEKVFRSIAITDPFRVGLDTVAFIWLEVVPRELKQVMERVEVIESVRYLAVTTGSYDLVAMVVLPSKKDLIHLLNQQLTEIPGIVNTETSIILEIHKPIPDWKAFRGILE